MNTSELSPSEMFQKWLTWFTTSVRSAIRDISHTKYPITLIVRVILMVVGWLILTLGTIVALLSWLTGEFSFLEFLVFTILVFFFTAGSLVIADLLSIAVRAEDHLDTLRRKSEREQAEQAIIANSAIEGD